MVHDATGAVMDTLGPFDGADMRMNVREQGGRITSVEFVRLVFGATTVATVSGDLLWVGTQDAPELRAFARTGDVVRILRTGERVEPVTDAVRRAVIDSAIARAEATVPAEQLPGIRASWENREMAESIPPYGRILTDRLGNLWVAEYAAPPGVPSLWQIFDPEGRRLAGLRLPPNVRVLEAGDGWLLVLERDDLDVEYVRLYDLDSG
jgi:hypothetical protein